MKKAIIIENMLLVLLTAFVAWLITAFFYQSALSRAKMSEIRDVLSVVANTDYENLDNQIKLLQNNTSLKVEIIDKNESNNTEIVKEARKVGYSEKSGFYGTFVAESLTAAEQLTDGRVIMVTSRVAGGNYTFLCIFISLLIAVVVSFNFAGRFVANIKFLIHGANLTLERAGNEGGIEVMPPPESLQYPDLVESSEELARTATVISNRVKELYIENKRVEYLLDNMREGLVVLHCDMSIVMINRSAAKFFDVNDDIKGQNVLELTHTPIISQTLDEVIKNGKPLAIDYNIVGTKTVLQILVSAVYNQEQEINGAIMLISDVTEVRLAEQIRSEFVANASHELKTPLTSIKGFSELIDSGMVQDPEKIHGYLTNIRSETERMIGLINDILELSEIESTVKDTGIIKLSLKILTQKVVASLENQIKAKNIKVSVSGDIGTIDGNSDHIQQVLLNLIDNAVKYNVENGSVDVTIAQKIDEVSVCVSDSGVGIPKECQQRVFERFYRVDKSRSRKQGGTGLGLSIVKHIVELYSGKIELESEIGKGTKITVHFPIKK